MRAILMLARMEAVMSRRLALVLCAALLAGCVATPQIQSTFNPAEAAFIHKPGRGSITGQAFLRRNDGVVVYAAGSRVTLIPRTTYSSERMQALYGGNRIAPLWRASIPEPAGYSSYVREEKADGEGKFSFSGLADGEYYVVTTVYWMAGYNQQGGYLMEPVTIRGGNAVNVIMTGS